MPLLNLDHLTKIHSSPHISLSLSPCSESLTFIQIQPQKKKKTNLPTNILSTLWKRWAGWLWVSCPMFKKPSRFRFPPFHIIHHVENAPFSHISQKWCQPISFSSVCLHSPQHRKDSKNHLKCHYKQSIKSILLTKP